VFLPESLRSRSQIASFGGLQLLREERQLCLFGVCERPRPLMLTELFKAGTLLLFPHGKCLLNDMAHLQRPVIWLFRSWYLFTWHFPG
jgi:hypothetical protein